MWVETTPNGKFKYCEQYIDNLTGKKKKVSTTFPKNTRETRSKAQKILLSKIAKKQSDENKEIISITFEKLTEKWLDVYKHQIRSSTFVSVESHLGLLKEIIGTDTIVHKITPIFLNKKIEELMFQEEGISQSYATTLKSRLNKIFEFAITHGHLKSNPVENMKIPRKKKATTKVNDFFFEDDELERFMSYLKEHNYRYYLLCQWLYLNGLRGGEGLAMKKTDIVITENEQYCKVNGTLEYHGKNIAEQSKSNETKTKAGIREVDLSSKAVEIYYEALKLSKDSDFLFSTSRGTPIQVSALNTYFRQHKERMGFSEDKRISTHIFRHTHVSKLAEIGVPIYEIQKRVGHENSGITQDIYLHITGRMKEKTKNLLELL
ncbi:MULTISPECIES: tyrosine-type recombinase/integrase [Lactococcus]|uniref:tyrosine-type recombinase/integrase n=1 Tax=Lactococcus TaxID=1357 RepID=UPI000EDE9BFC|nr:MULTISPECIES: site-specific integrase [Lactococcus]MBS4464270.1 site-specific integrase [Lactococcus garvieae]HCS85337.1 site-specific integrase [Lactococcus garvieae]